MKLSSKVKVVLERCAEHNWEETMDANEKDLDVLTQEEIERFLEEQQTGLEKHDDVEADLASLLSELENGEDEDIMEISSLLNKADNNEAVADDVVALMKQQEADGTTAYDAMDLFSGADEQKKEGFFQKLIKNHKQKKQTKKEEAAKKKEEKAKDKKEKSNKKTLKEENKPAEDAETVSVETIDDEPKPEKKVKEKSRKDKKSKKEKKKKNLDSGQALDVDAEELEKDQEKDAKKKKEKKGIEKKKAKKEGEEVANKREESSLEDAMEMLEDESLTPPSKKKIVMVFVAAIMIMLGFLVVYFYFTGHANKKLAEEAYKEEDYLECYQLMYGQQLNDSQAVMFHRSELILKMDIFKDDYNGYVETQCFLEALDELVQFVYDFPELSSYANKWNCLSVVQDTYEDVIYALAKDYDLSEEEVLDIAELESDVEYTRALLEVIEEKQKQDAWNMQYPDMLPQEKDRIMQSE